MNHPREYKDKQVVILGLAKSGLAAAKVFHAFGAVVTVNDNKERAMCPEADELEALGVSVICGHHPDHLIHSGVSLVVKNPGIPYSVPPLVKAAGLGIEVITEVEAAHYLCGAPMIGITGSNGKTTTTTWVGKIFEAVGLHPIVAGNIGKPLCEAVQGAGPEDWMIVELSSFQLKGTDQFHPHIACLLNVYETHLDYHGTLEDYTASKLKIFANQGEQDFAVINWDDAFCRKIMPSLKAKVFPFSRKESLPFGVFVSARGSAAEAKDSPMIIYRDPDGEEHAIIPVNQIGIPGKHNIENALAAASAAIAAGVAIEAVAKALREFRGVEHRQEFVGEIGKVLFYNDSKATNPSATIKAIDSFEQEIILIAGGLERGMDYLELVPWFADKVKAVVALGETRMKMVGIAEAAGVRMNRSVDSTEKVEAMDQAVAYAVSFASAGDVILLSPACASWDMYTSYEERGRMFKDSFSRL